MKKTLAQILAMPLIAGCLAFADECNEIEDTEEEIEQPQPTYNNINLPAEDYNSHEGRTEGRPRSNAEDRD